MDGTELARRIRSLRPKLPLVLFSSLGRREAGEAETLFDAFLAKPVRQSQLFDTLVTLVSPPPGREGGRAGHGRRSTRAWPRATRCASCSPRTTS